MITLTDFFAVSSTGKTVHRKGTDVYGRRISLVEDDTAESFEEVEAAPTFSRAEYNARVEALIAERYTTGQEIQFAREREAAGEKYTEYLTYVEECKVRAVEELNYQR